MKKIVGMCVLIAVFGMVSFAAAQVATSTLPDPGTLPDSPLYFFS